MADKEQVAPVVVSIEPLVETDIDSLDPILEQHLRDRNTGEFLVSEIEEIKGYMRGEKDDCGRSRTYFVAKNPEGEVLGCMAYSEPDPDMLAHFKTNVEESAELLNAFVLSSVYRGGGIGRKLFNAICEAVRREGKRQLLVHSGPRYKGSWGFYDKMYDVSCGFLIGKYGKGGDAKTWRKRL